MGWPGNPSSHTSLLTSLHPLHFARYLFLDFCVRGQWWQDDHALQLAASPAVPADPSGAAAWRLLVGSSGCLNCHTTGLWLLLSKICLQTALTIQFAEHIRAGALEEHGNIFHLIHSASGSQPPTTCLINVFVAVCATEAVQLTPAGLRSLSQKSSMADFVHSMSMSVVLGALLFLELHACLRGHVRGDLCCV